MLCEMRGILALVGVAVIPATEGYVNGYALAFMAQWLDRVVPSKG